MTINPKMPPAELAVGWLTMLLVGTDLFVFSPLLPTLSANYNISSNVAGLCVTIFSLSYMIGAPLFGHISDQVGKRRVLICCLLAFGTANLLTASAASFPMAAGSEVICRRSRSRDLAVNLCIGR